MPSDRRQKLTRSVIFWSLAALLAYAPYAQGLFFERDFLYVLLVVGILTLLAVLSLGKSSTFLMHKQDLIAIGFLLAYCLGATGAVQAKAAVVEILKIATYILVYLLFARGRWQVGEHIRFLQVIFWSGLGVAVLGIGAALGSVDLVGGYVNNRIYSTFQYPNTLAVYLGGLVLIGAYLRWKAAVKFKWLYFPALSIILTCLIATGSRGGIGVSIILLPIFYWLLPKSVRGGIIKPVLFSGAIAFVGALAFLKFLSDQNPAGGWAVIIFMLILASALDIGVKSFDKIRLRYLIVGLFLVGIIFTLVYNAGGDNPLARIKGSSLKLHEFQERLAYYRDGLNMIIERPVRGFGGGGWAMYPRYQGYPYWVSDPHNSLIKIGVESGFPGVLFFVSWWLGLGYITLRKRAEGEVLPAVLFCVLLIVGLHSLLDFDLSYGAIGLLVWGLGGMIAAGQAPLEGLQRGFIKYSGLLAICISAIILIGSAVAFLDAAEDAAYGSVYNEEGKVLSSLLRYDAARVKDPFNANYPAAQAEIYFGSEQAKNPAKAFENINSALVLDSAELKYKTLASQIFLARGDLEKAAALAEDVLSFKSFEPEAYLDLARFYEDLANKAKEQGALEDSRGYLLKGAQMAERFRARMNRVPPREAALWPAGKPDIPPELTQKCKELQDRAQ